MTIPWLTRLPTPEEVAAHARVHPASPDSLFGLWLQECPGWFPSLRLVMVGGNGQVEGLRAACGARFLPCTAEGIPVCFLEGA